MRITNNVADTVVFLGLSEGDEVKPGATGFFVAHEGFGYLVTCAHVAKALEGLPYWIRLNKQEGDSAVFEADDNVEWCYHPDPLVDLAVVGVNFGADATRFRCKYLNSNMLLDEQGIISRGIGIGDFTYTVGLFKRVAGKTKNLPIVHCGNIAMMPDEPIPVKDWRQAKTTESVEINVYLVESQSLRGLSGSPVFVRGTMNAPEIHAENDEKDFARVPRVRMQLLGVWHGAWDAPPGEIYTADYNNPDRVPVGMGIVVPAWRILEILEGDELKKDREVAKKAVDEQTASTPDMAIVNVDQKRDEILETMLNTPPDPKGGKKK